MCIRDRYQSALCRQKADWLIGINASRLFSVLYHRTPDTQVASLQSQVSRMVWASSIALSLIHI